MGKEESMGLPVAIPNAISSSSYLALNLVGLSCDSLVKVMVDMMWKVLWMNIFRDVVISRSISRCVYIYIYIY